MVVATMPPGCCWPLAAGEGKGEEEDGDEEESMVSGACTFARRGRVTSGKTTRVMTPNASLCPCPDCSGLEGQG